MKFKTILLCVIGIMPAIVSCQSNTNNVKKYEIKDAVIISIPIELELRNDNSDIARAVDNYRDEYNKNNVQKIGKSQLIFQPIGTNNNEKKAITDDTRITVAYFKNERNIFPKWNDNLDNLVTEELNQFLKKEFLQIMEDMPFQTTLIKWNPIEVGKINNQSYLKTSVVYQEDYDNKKQAYSESYHFFNQDEKVVLTLVTDYPVQEKWKQALMTTISTFNFKSKK